MKYSFLKREDIPESLRDKPKWVSFVILASGVLLLTMSAVSVGAMLGYTYCYIEHRGMKYDREISLNVSTPGYPDTESARYNRTINGALTSILVSKLKILGCKLLNNPLSRVHPSNYSTAM